MSSVGKRHSLEKTVPAILSSAVAKDDLRQYEGDLSEPAAAETIEAMYVEAEARRLHDLTESNSRGETAPASDSRLLRDLLNISHVLSDGASAMVDDSFLRCFACQTADPWNFTIYLWPVWFVGVIFRHAILFPLRLLGLVGFICLTLLVFFPVSFLMKPGPLKKSIERKLVHILPKLFLMSWSAVIRYHGPKPIPAPGRVWVSNHTSMIDYALICGLTPFAVIMQLHSGWIAFLQTRVLSSLGCLWFNRTDMKDRHVVAKRMQNHVFGKDTVPLLIFPEGTCVNNEYTVMFKRGAFDIQDDDGTYATVCPIAIKYNKIFVDAFHNSKKESFSAYLLKLMSSWAVVADVWFLEPQQRKDGESADEFAARVQLMIAERAKLNVVPWDGYLKYYNLGAKNPGLIEKRRKVFADVLRKYLPEGGSTSAGVPEPKKDL